jgi:putative NAD(P)-binding protein
MIFLTGATGYMGRRLAAELLRRGHEVTALVRKGSEGKAPAGCSAVVGDALDASSYRERVPKGATFVHLIGVAHPSPAKAAEFLSVDLVSIRAAVDAARFAEASHFVYVSVAHPVPVMQAYIAVRSQGEELLRASGLRATILRPWYVLGPGHWWPVALIPDVLDHGADSEDARSGNVGWACLPIPSITPPAECGWSPSRRSRAALFACPDRRNSQGSASARRLPCGLAIRDRASSTTPCPGFVL